MALRAAVAGLALGALGLVDPLAVAGAIPGITTLGIRLNTGEELLRLVLLARLLQEQGVAAAGFLAGEAVVDLVVDFFIVNVPNILP